MPRSTEHGGHRGRREASYPVSAALCASLAGGDGEPGFELASMGSRSAIPRHGRISLLGRICPRFGGFAGNIVAEMLLDRPSRKPSSRLCKPHVELSSTRGRCSIPRPEGPTLSTTRTAACLRQDWSPRRLPPSGSRCGAVVLRDRRWALAAQQMRARRRARMYHVWPLDRTGARMHSRRFCIGDILAPNTWGRRPLVCLGSRGDQYWALFWST